MKIRYPSLILAAGLFCVFFTQASKAYSAVLINEVYPNPQSGEDEWVELLNTGDTSADLSGWQLRDRLATSSLIKQFGENTWLEPASFLVISFKSILNNDGDSVVLYNHLGEEISALSFSHSTKGLSWNRAIDQETFFEAQPTPNGPNEILAPSPSPAPTPIPTTTNLSPVLSEIMACPADRMEWIEIFNPHDESLSLLGFSLRDAKNQIFIFDDEILPAHSFTAIDLKNVLNNDADEVWLLNPAHQAEDYFSYTSCSAALSFAVQDGQWQETSIITKGASNIFSSLPEKQSAQSKTSIASNSAASSVLATENDLLPPTPLPSFLYPPSVLTPQLAYEKPSLPIAENIHFADPPRLEKGALNVIMGSSFLLIPAFIYVKNKQAFF